MTSPISHKLAPFLYPEKLVCEGPIAGYASYAEAPHTKTSPAYAQASAGWPPPYHLQNTADFLKTIQAQKQDSLLDIFCVDHESHLTLNYLFGNGFQLSLDFQSDLSVPSLTHLYANANWLECECYDLFGVRFEGHPHLKRLLLYPEFAGHPLRKAYPINKAQPLIPIYA
ncbi:MAG: NADH-quinone oxidoreductase subunit C [Myxococcaceae bacterium]